MHLGGSFLQKFHPDENLWDSYTNNLPHPLTPARSKGMVFDYQGRVKAKLPLDFIEKQKNYHDDFIITQRKKINVTSNVTSTLH